MATIATSTPSALVPLMAPATSRSDPVSRGFILFSVYQLLLESEILVG
jgi:hypothetical protein